MTAQAVERAGRSVARRGVVAWLLVRLTGLLLTVLVLGHFALTHILTDVAEVEDEEREDRHATDAVGVEGPAAGLEPVRGRPSEAPDDLGQDDRIPDVPAR